MTDSGSELKRQAAAAELPRHRRLLTAERDAKILNALMLPAIWRIAPRGSAVLTTIGRKTGKVRRKTVRVVRQGGNRVYVVALKPPNLTLQWPDAVQAWVWNIRSNPKVWLKLREGNIEGEARELADPADLKLARAALCDNVYPIDYAECALHLRGFPTRTKIVHLHQYWFDTGTPLVIELGDLKRPE